MAIDRMNVEWKGGFGGTAVRMASIESQLRSAADGQIAPPDGDVSSTSIRFGEDLHQRDTYFVCRGSRLKLREIRGSGSELIWYRRPNEARVRTCQYRRLVIAQPECVKSGLAATLGIETEVVKDRRLFWWRNVRIHLDRVQDLGDFIEFEAVLTDASQLSRGQRQLAELMQWLGLEDGQAIATSYRELSLEKRT